MVTLNPLTHAYRLYVAGETRAAAAGESLVASNAFGEFLATSASNAMAIAKIVNGGADRGVRMLRVAGRADITSLARQLARTEDKLEHVLQLVEELTAQLAAVERAPAPRPRRPAAATGVRTP